MKEESLYRFSNLKSAASFALQCCGPALVFDGPEDDYVVAVGREARELEDDGHVACTLAETAQAAEGEE